MDAGGGRWRVLGEEVGRASALLGAFAGAVVGLRGAEWAAGLRQAWGCAGGRAGTGGFAGAAGGAGPACGVLFLGTGVSTGLPRLSCVVQEPAPGQPRCPVCWAGLRDPRSPDRRNNVSIIVRFWDREGQRRHLMVDVGKTMREAMLRWCPQGFSEPGQKDSLGRGLDAVVLTHGHADAMGGMDDLRDLQPRAGRRRGSGPGAGQGSPSSIPVFCNRATFEVCSQSFPYLVPKLRDVTREKEGIERRVASLEWNLIDDTTPFLVHGLKVTPLPLFHGGNYISLGFAFGEAAEFVYLSDVSSVPQRTMETLRRQPIGTLVVDCLLRKPHPSHFSLGDALDLVRELHPLRALLVGMSCSLGRHDDVCRELAHLRRTEGLDVQLARDGMWVETSDLTDSSGEGGHAQHAPGLLNRLRASWQGH